MAKPAIEKYQQQDKKAKAQKNPDNKRKPNQEKIQTVPKARKQPRPTVVTKPKQTKPVRPNNKK